MGTTYRSIKDRDNYDYKLFTKLAMKYGQNGFDRLRERGYNDVLEFKALNLIGQIGGATSDYVLELPDINEEVYTRQMMKVFRSEIQTSCKNAEYREEHKLTLFKNLGSRTYKEMLGLLDTLSPSEIIENRTMQSYRVLGKRYDAGMKTLKLIGKYQRELDTEFPEKKFGRLKIDPSEKGRIFINIKPEAFINAGIEGDSCLSPDSDNEAASLIYSTMSFMAVAHDKNFNWRAWVAVSPDDRVFAISQGYPRESFYGQLTVYNYFKKMGYELVSMEDFQIGCYFEGDGPLDEFINEDEIRGREIQQEEMTNTCMYTGDSVAYETKNASYSYCDGCDKEIIGADDFEQGYCQECAEDNLVFCELIEDYVPEGEEPACMEIAYELGDDNFIKDIMEDLIGPEDSGECVCALCEGCITEDLPSYFMEQMIDEYDNIEGVIERINKDIREYNDIVYEYTSQGYNQVEYVDEDDWDIKEIQEQIEYKLEE